VVSRKPLTTPQGRQRLHCALPEQEGRFEADRPKSGRTQQPIKHQMMNDYIAVNTKDRPDKRS